MRKLPILAALALLVTGTYAFAGASQMESGRPSAVLNETQCQEVWKKAVPSGDTLAQADATPFIVNFTQIDADGNGTISITEFQAACGKGLVKYTDR
jgi:hypothetical protein